MPPFIDYTQPLELLPDPLPIEPLRKPFDVTITPPGSKSITCRAYVLAALAEGESKIIRALRADDTDHLLNALCTLGAEARWDGEDVFIKGVAGRFPRGGNLYMGDGGAPTRFMIACACLAEEPVVIDASPRMRERPIAEGVDMLRQLGAKIEYVEAEGRLPVRVVPSGTFQGGELVIGISASSQFISALLLIAPCLENGVKLVMPAETPSPTYVALTRHMLGQWSPGLEPPVSSGSPTHQFWSALDGEPGGELTITHQHIEARTIRTESDASSAAYWFVAAWLFPPSGVRVYAFNRLRPIQPDLRLLLELKHANLIDLTLSATEPPYDSHFWEVTRGRKTGKLKCDCSLFPDGAIALIVGSAMMKGKSRFTGLRTLRVKETDRITALANELRKVGCTVETGEDWISIEPPRGRIRAATVRERGDAKARVEAPRSSETADALPYGHGSEHSTGSENPVIIETYNDHRMAMAFAILGLVRPGLSIRNPACVKKSYPGFWKDFAKLYAD